MKKTIKKLAAFAMAFTLLGTGTTLTKNIAPQLDNSITVSAACHAHGQFVTTAYDWRYDHTAKTWETFYDAKIGRKITISPGIVVWRKYKYKKCGECGQQWGSATKMNSYSILI